MKKARVYHDKQKSKPYIVKYYTDDGRRTSLSFKFKLEADDFAASCNTKCDMPLELRFSVSERIEFSKIKAFCESRNIALEQVVDLLKPNSAMRSIKGGARLEDAKNEFLKNCRERGMREATYVFYKSLVESFIGFAAADGISIFENLSKAYVEDYLESIKRSLHAKRALSAWGTYCEKKGYLPYNIFKGIKLAKKLTDKHNPSILSVDDAKDLFRALPAAWAPAFALMAFAGIRPEEIVASKSKKCLKPGHIDFVSQKITVPAAVSKTRKTRILSDLPENLWKWIEPLRDSKKICGSYGEFRKVKSAMPVRIPHDALRHSFASYGYYRLGAEHTVDILGHNFAVFQKHYKGLATKDDSEKYFMI